MEIMVRVNDWQQKTIVFDAPECETCKEKDDELASLRKALRVEKCLNTSEQKRLRFTYLERFAIVQMWVNTLRKIEGTPEKFSMPDWFAHTGPHELELDEQTGYVKNLPKAVMDCGTAACIYGCLVVAYPQGYNMRRSGLGHIIDPRTGDSVEQANIIAYMPFAKEEFILRLGLSGDDNEASIATALIEPEEGWNNKTLDGRVYTECPVHEAFADLFRDMRLDKRPEEAIEALLDVIHTRSNMPVT